VGVFGALALGGGGAGGLGGLVVGGHASGFSAMRFDGKPTACLGSDQQTVYAT